MSGAGWRHLLHYLADDLATNYDPDDGYGTHPTEGGVSEDGRMPCDEDGWWDGILAAASCETSGENHD